MSRWLEGLAPIGKRGNRSYYNHKEVWPILLDLKARGASGLKDAEIPQTADGMRDMARGG